jgi:phage major head subunit gpT-like protein
VKEKNQFVCEAAMVIEAATAEGKVPRFSLVAYTGGPLRQFWSDDPIVVDLAGMSVPATLPILKSHSTYVGGIGHATDIRNDGKTLTMSGEVSRDTEEAREFVASAKKGYPWKASIGCTIQALTRYREGTVTVNGQTFSAPVAVATKSTLYETSIVELPADAGTSVAVAASKPNEGNTTMKTLEAAGTTPAATDTTATPAVTAAQASPDFTAQRAVQAAEMERVAAIQKVTASAPEIAAQAIREGWSAERAELAVLRASRPSAPGVIVAQAPEITDDVLAAAVCQASGSKVEASFDAKTVEASQKAFRGRMGLQQLVYLCAQRNGYNGSPFLRGASELREALRAAFSTGTLASVLSSASNKHLMEAFNGVEQAWRKVARINANVNDFKSYNTYAYTGDATFAQVAKDGQITHGTVADETYENKLETFARMMGFTRQDLINDDLGILASRAQKLGRGAGLALNKVFWKAFLNNAAFFTAGNGNYISGATTTLTSVGLGLADKAFGDLLGPDGNPLGLGWKFLLVPPALKQAAMELQLSSTVNTGGSASTEKVPNANIWGGTFETVVSTYLANLKNGDGDPETGVSSLAWYCLADPADLPVIEVGFLRGAVGPTVEEVALDPHYLGIEMRGYIDFGVALQVPQAGVKSKGAA